MSISLHVTSKNLREVQQGSNYPICVSFSVLHQEMNALAGPSTSFLKGNRVSPATYNVLVAKQLGLQIS